MHTSIHDYSTRYHLLYPAYIHERLKQLGRTFDLRVVLMLIDVVSIGHVTRLYMNIHKREHSTTCAL